MREGEYMTEKIAAFAVESMLYEVAATPKPGLVDRANNGAHNDMDFFTFMSSAAALHDTFDRMIKLGVQKQSSPIQELLPMLRKEGRLAGWEYGISASTMSIPTWHPSAYAKDGGIITTASIPWA